MNPFINPRKVVMSVLTVIWIANPSYTQTSTPLKPLWEQEFGCGYNMSCSPGAVSFDTADGKLLIIGTSFRPILYSDGKFRLWKIDQNGNITKNIILQDANEVLKANIKTASLVIKGLSISKSGTICTIGNFDNIALSVMTMNRQGNTQIIKTVSGTSLIDDNNFILKKIDLPNDNALLVGRDRQDNGLVVKIDSQGNKMWEKTHDLGQLEFFSDGIAIGDNGDFILAGGSIKHEGESTTMEPLFVWILKCNSEGKIISEKLFSGNPFVRKMPQICQLSSGELILAYDNNTDTILGAGNLRIKAISPDLKTILWEQQVLEDGITASTFKIKAVPNKGFVVAFGVGSADIGIYEYDKTGYK
ncbi:MAG: hypothetical protein JXB29_08025, partial [Sedimentisphaerales bacterium]|nr:hypothetical protein [Sedimentisphaerales bacterium]